MNSVYSELIDKSTKQIKESNYNTENPLNDLRKLLDINFDKLNEIEPPNIINKIWDKIKTGIKNNNVNLTYDDLFGDGLTKYYPNQKISVVMKVNGLYNLLNSIGYHPDKNLRNDNKFIPFINDHRHAGNAIYSDFFITRDKRLIKKAEAIYEHLKIGTKIIFIH
ncbi:hypothetical protein APF79_04405 [bacterium BRH_c32]|nr:MAG: hypothetical protein APF79_11940 [bacterium BRH_c32]KUO63172.1 MAG: hypothetical protein APF79_04405 [bacterium BRH_c32]